jgi:hypothetical protein
VNEEQEPKKYQPGGMVTTAWFPHEGLVDLATFLNVVGSEPRREQRWPA